MQHWTRPRSPTGMASKARRKSPAAAAPAAEEPATRAGAAEADDDSDDSLDLWGCVQVKNGLTKDILMGH